MKFDFFIVGISGFVGSIARYCFYLWFNQKNLNSFPWATLSINILGCFLIGVVGSWVERSVPHHRELFLAGSIGFLGAFTTFSAFGFETLGLIRNQQVNLAILNILANVVVGIVAVGAGRSLAALYS